MVGLGIWRVELCWEGSFVWGGCCWRAFFLVVFVWLTLSLSRFEQIRPPAVECPCGGRTTFRGQNRPPATESPVNLLSKGSKRLEKPSRAHKQHHVRISCNHRLSLEFLKRYQGGIDTPSHAVPSRLRKKFANPKTSDTSSYVKR